MPIKKPTTLPKVNTSQSSAQVLVKNSNVMVGGIARVLMIEKITAGKYEAQLKEACASEKQHS